MNVEKLEKSMVIPNYKKLCELLELNVTTGSSKKAQLKEMDRYFKYHKSGNKFIIEEIYDEILLKIDGRKNNIGGANNVTEYTKNIEKLILDLLLQGGNSRLGFGKVFLSKNQLLKEFEMINDNYVYCKRRIPKLSKFMNINQDTVEEWYDINDDMLERNLDQSLKSLENKSLIFWSREITVAETIPMAEILEEGTEIIKTKSIDNYGEEQIDYKYYASEKIELNYREGTEKEKAFILQTERDVLKELYCESKQRVIQLGMWDIFKSKVDDIVLKELNVAFYYKSYKIIFNEKHISEAIEDIYESFKLSKRDRVSEKSILNMEIINRGITNSINRYDKAVLEKSKIIGKGKNNSKYKRIKRRSDENYVSDNIELSNNLITRNAEDIKVKVKKTKLDTTLDDDFFNDI